MLYIKSKAFLRKLKRKESVSVNKERLNAIKSSRVEIDGIIYESTKEASDAILLREDTIIKRCLSSKISNWRYMEN